MGGLFVIGLRLSGSVQGVHQIVFDAVDVEERQVLAGIRSLSVVLFLVSDVLAERRVVRSTHGECSVPVLPLEIAPMREALVYPSCGLGLDGADEVCDGDGGRSLHVQVYVVPHASSTEQLSVLSCDDRCHARK
jgi:hypothetical protein